VGARLAFDVGLFIQRRLQFDPPPRETAVAAEFREYAAGLVTVGENWFAEFGALPLRSAPQVPSTKRTRRKAVPAGKGA
jgi:hypothetical protein